MRKVEVDEEVFALVQKHAEPLVDSFNSALRRILASGRSWLGAGQSEPATGAVVKGEGCELPSGTPEALRQILGVVRLVHAGTDTRRGATHRVAVKLGVAPQTVVDKYTRQLGMTAAQFERLLVPERREELQNLLHAMFPRHAATVDRVLGEAGSRRKAARREHVLDVADRLFGPQHGVELPFLGRGTAPHRPPPDFAEFDQDR